MNSNRNYNIVSRIDYSITNLYHFLIFCSAFLLEILLIPLSLLLITVIVTLFIWFMLTKYSKSTSNANIGYM